MSNYNSNLQSNNTNLQSILDTINALPEAGINLPELTNQATSEDLLVNKQLIDQDGNIIEGSMPNNGTISQTMDGINTKSITIPAGYTSGGSVSLDNTIDNEVTEQSDLIAQIKNVVNNLPEAGSGGGGTVETCTVTLGRSVVFLHSACLTTYTAESGMSALSIENISSDTIIEHVVCGSMIAIYTSRALIPAYAVTGGAELIYNDYNHLVWYFSVPKNPTGSVSITVRDDD